MIRPRELPKRIRLRWAHVGKGERPVDDVDALAADALVSAAGPNGDLGGSHVAAMAPPNWVPSQQDERPRH